MQSMINEICIFAKNTHHMNTRILIIGACGQIGTELTKKLRSIYRVDHVVVADIR